MEIQHSDVAGRPTWPAVDLDLVEVDAAIELVARGAAVRVRVVGLRDPFAVAGRALAAAQRAGVELRLERSADRATITVGPRLAATSDLFTVQGGLPHR